MKHPPFAVRLRQVGGDAHTTWLRDALTAAGIKAPVLGGIPKVCCVLTVHVASRSREAVALVAGLGDSCLSIRGTTALTR